MKTISVKAEGHYDVLVDCNWKHELISIAKDRTRIAIIHSSSMSDAVRLDADIDGEVFYFSLPDGEDAKSFPILSKLWDWLGAGGFTRSDLVVGIAGAITDVAALLRHLGCGIGGWACQQVLLEWSMHP